MNCQLAQKKITDAFAAGETVLPPDLASHCAACAGCGAFCETQRRLFASINSGLQDIVNHPVPLSFFLRVHARLDHTPASRSFWTPKWSYAALAAIVVLAFTFAFLRDDSSRRDSPLQSNRIVARVDHEPGSEASTISREIVSPWPAPRRARERTSVSSNRPGGGAPDVIVLAEEQRAFARFLAHVPQQAAGALPKPAAAGQTESPIDIALIEIQDVEITPLESMNGDGR